jgi:hypothetical protein
MSEYSTYDNTLLYEYIRQFFISDFFQKFNGILSFALSYLLTNDRVSETFVALSDLEVK